MKNKKAIKKSEVPVIIRKQIDLDETVVEKLELLAKADRRKLKPYMEIVLTNHAKNTAV